uniref:Uncharacterized protein n=1 Tax=Trichobilharzia regenti TaxID=157069 RepID=A0AA85JNF8_TRIRE|nr:unnamed protein product [Trichobilharzia regenti]CAH8822231.1 unnamed protein product [Trichobilharzia regenti]
MVDETPNNLRFRPTESEQFQKSSERQPNKSPSLIKSFYELGRFGKPIGFSVNWGAMLAYAAIVGYINPSITFPLYLAGVNWTMIYDTIYAHQDVNDDILIGVKSTAVLFGEKTKSYLAIFHTGMTVCFLIAGINAQAGWIYYLGTLCTMLHIANMIREVDLKNPASCSQTFETTRTSGLLFFLTIVLDNMYT